MDSIRVKTPIFLIGFMGSGKSYWGRRIAQKFALEWRDLDTYLSAHYQKSITELFEAETEAGFRDLERKALIRICESNVQLLSTGGGTPCFYDNLALMNAIGTSIYLKAPVELLLKRLAPDLESRPLIKGLALPELRKFVAQKLEQREKFYEKAHFIIEVQQEETLIEADLIKLIFG